MADFLTAWRNWLKGRAVAAWELAAVTKEGSVPPSFKKAAEALFGELPQKAFAMGGHLETYRGFEANGLRLEAETITNDAGERIRRYRVVELKSGDDTAQEAEGG